MGPRKKPHEITCIISEVIHIDTKGFNMIYNTKEELEID